ncbi:hypothetical protein [Methylobacterium isbiliense]|uniref:Intein C-terminal splicing domain-containing protein n=1 Tax=Methylobacterium isbiliense TaxID=315478 RepID=A0ABQ4SDH8_9HYPH|nr:hypothetical protein [Methylobacterium isbiliense]MDN3622601.1 hypothetical protein [Methylobacterium isbiliense]GJE00550.1 hypothetical protein GMJLKIPL_2473 [Methylobacterium isbiliense]
MAAANRLDQLIDAWAPRLQRAFLAAVADIRDRARIGVIVTMLERGDIDGAVRAVGLDSAAFRALDAALVQAFEEGGNYTTVRLPALREPDGYRLEIRFDVRNPRAEAWLRDHSSTAVREILDDQRTLIRASLDAGMAAGRNPRDVALDLVGRIDPKTKRRDGGAIGLTSSQEAWVRRYADELARGDLAALDRQLRDKRFDGTVRKAVAAGKPLTAEQIAAMVAAYRNRALRYRAETIGRTEAMAALHQSQDEAMQQAIDAGQIQEGRVMKVWRSAGDGRVRDTHRGLNGKAVPFNGAFVSASGARLRFPGDPLAPASEIVNCFAPWSTISMVGLKAVVAREYSGELVELTAGGVVNLAVTPNHPVLTQRGWVPASGVIEGDHLVYCSGHDRFAAPRAMNVDHAHASAQHLSNAASTLGDHLGAGFRRVDFHGEVPDKDVNIVTFPIGLCDDFKSMSYQCFGHLGFARADVLTGETLYRRLLMANNSALSQLSDRGMSAANASNALAGIGQCSSTSVPFRGVEASQPEIVKAPVNKGAADAEMLGNPIHGVAGRVQTGHLGMQLESFRSAVCGRPSPLESLRFGSPERSQPEIGETPLSELIGDAKRGCDGASRGALSVQRSNPLEMLRPSRCEPSAGGGTGALVFSAVRVDGIRHLRHSGVVYNFETVTNLIIAEGVIVHNCRCTMETRIDFLAGIA